MNNKENTYKDYEYMKVRVLEKDYSAYIDGYKNFGWFKDENVIDINEGLYVIIALKRDRRILNKVELTRLQQNFEDCMKQIERLHKYINIPATILASLTGMSGVLFMMGAVWMFCDIHRINPVNILLACIGIFCQVMALYVYKKIYLLRYVKINPLIEIKQDELYEICNKGRKLFE